MTTASKFTTEVLQVDSFSFQRRRFLRKTPGFEWDQYLPRNHILNDLDFRLQRENGSTTVRFRHTPTSKDGAGRSYAVKLDHTPCRHGGRYWFRCPECGERRRHLYISRGQQRFVCRRCAGLRYEGEVRNHNPVYIGFIRPTQLLQRAAIGLIRSRSSKKRQHFRVQADAARGTIAEFAKRWHKIAARVVSGKAGVRDKRSFDELSTLLLDSEIRDLVEANLAERTTAGENRSREPRSIDVYALAKEGMEGGEELLASTYSQAFRSAGSDPTRQKLFALVAIMTHRLGRHYKNGTDEDYEDYALACMASAQYIEDLAADPVEAPRSARRRTNGGPHDQAFE